ncbi:Hypothetical_protein [Hexamita inflata]|uniref:Hypothetical_protein n=1 Tax=Hexamita inflata TaxID=28002 RepID=A0AA86Q212_9EUKA|nr:Hypothetical protein HINF_LOCUS32860 [Hexamita inflata]
MSMFNLDEFILEQPRPAPVLPTPTTVQTLPLQKREVLVQVPNGEYFIKRVEQKLVKDMKQITEGVKITDVGNEQTVQMIFKAVTDEEIKLIQDIGRQLKSEASRDENKDEEIIIENAKQYQVKEDETKIEFEKINKYFEYTITVDTKFQDKHVVEGAVEMIHEQFENAVVQQNENNAIIKVNQDDIDIIKNMLATGDIKFSVEQNKEPNRQNLKQIEIALNKMQKHCQEAVIEHFVEHMAKYYDEISIAPNYNIMLYCDNKKLQKLQKLIQHFQVKGECLEFFVK